MGGNKAMEPQMNSHAKLHPFNHYSTTTTTRKAPILAHRQKQCPLSLNKGQQPPLFSCNSSSSSSSRWRRRRRRKRISTLCSFVELASSKSGLINTKQLLILSIIISSSILITLANASALPVPVTTASTSFRLPTNSYKAASTNTYTTTPTTTKTTVQNKDNQVNYNVNDRSLLPLNEMKQQEQFHERAIVSEGDQRWSFVGSSNNNNINNNLDALEEMDFGLDLMAESAGSSLNKSLNLLEDMKQQQRQNSSLLINNEQLQATSDLNLMRRQLIRQLTSLIMNHEPERIAEQMEGTRVSGQLVSESELYNGDGGITVTPANSEIEPHEKPKKSSAFTVSQPLLSPSMLVSSGSGTTIGEDDNLMTIQDTQAADDQISNSDSVASDDGGGGGSGIAIGNNKNDNKAAEETYVTCPPDYEDTSVIEAASSSSNNNLTLEQQQQLLAGADSSGLLTVNGSNQETAEQVAAAAAAAASSAVGRPTGTPGTCVMAGSRMIEVIAKVIAPILFSIIIVVGLLGNIIVMIVILEDRKTEREYTPTGLLILDLSLADLSFIIFCIPFTAWDYSVGHWVFGSLWCKFNQYLIVVCALSSIYTLVLMSVDRFLAIVYPIECMSYRTTKNTLYAIYIKWILILAMASPTITMHGLIDSPFFPDEYTCRFLADKYNPLHFQVIFFITSYLFPLILIFCLYLSLLNKLWFGSKPHGHKESLKTLESKKKVTWLVASIVVVFALCWCPIQIMLILMRLKSHKITATYVAIQVLSHTLGYMNSCVNPIVYAFASESFHNSFKRSSVGRFCYMVFCVKNSHHHHHSTYNNNSNHHNNNNDQERAITTNNFRTIHHTSSNNNNNNNASLHNNQHLLQQDQSQNHVPLRSQSLTTRNGCTSTTLGGSNSPPPNNGHNNMNETRMINLPPPLEPRDRIMPHPMDTSQLVGNEPKRVISSSQVDDTLPIQNQQNINQSSSTCNQQQQVPAKQQLVARMVQSGNQAPCYQQELLKSP